MVVGKLHAHIPLDTHRFPQGKTKVTYTQPSKGSRNMKEGYSDTSSLNTMPISVPSLCLKILAISTVTFCPSTVRERTRRASQYKGSHSMGSRLFWNSASGLGEDNKAGLPDWGEAGMHSWSGSGVETGIFTRTNKPTREVPNRTYDEQT